MTIILKTKMGLKFSEKMKIIKIDSRRNKKLELTIQELNLW